ncbi:MAG TPA: trigger factor [Caldithrix sp.]|nr:trigger factor [Caldithrix sp.]
MHIETETINAYSKRLKVEISAEELKALEEKIVRRYQRSSNIRGFRRGHAPLNIIRQRYRSMIQQDLIEETFREYYGKAIDQAGIQPVAPGNITKVDFEKIEDGLHFEMELQVEPEFELKKYKGLKVEKDVVNVTDELIEENLAHLQEQYATVKEVDEAKVGDYLFFDAQELDAGNVPVVGHKYENLEMKLGSGKFDPEIEEQLVGIKVNEKRIVTQETPPDPNDPKQEPKISRLEITAKKIEEREIPELNDDFVKNLDDESLETLEQLRQRIATNLELNFQHRSEETFNNRLIDELLKENPFDVPPGMVENYLDEMIKDFRKQSKDKNIDEEAVRKQYRPAAIHHLRWYFLRKKLIEAENISVSDEEAFRSIDTFQMDEKTREQAKKDRNYLNRLKDDLLEKKILDMLKSYAESIEVFPMEKSVIEEPSTP